MWIFIQSYTSKSTCKNLYWVKDKAWPCKVRILLTNQQLANTHEKEAVNMTNTGLYITNCRKEIVILLCITTQFYNVEVMKIKLTYFCHGLSLVHYL